MSFSIGNRLNNLAAQTKTIIRDLSQKNKAFIVDIVNTQQPSNQALPIQSHTETRAPVIDPDNKIRHVLSV